VKVTTGYKGQKTQRSEKRWHETSWNFRKDRQRIKLTTKCLISGSKKNEPKLSFGEVKRRHPKASKLLRLVACDVHVVA
jgi:hypothetical protein